MTDHADQGTTALSIPVLKELAQNADAGSREHELPEIQRFLNAQRYSEEEAYQVITAVGQLDPDQYPFERCAKLIEGGVSPEMLPTVLQQIDALAENSGLSEELVPLALSVFRDGVAADGDVSQADIEQKVRETLGDNATPEQAAAFLELASRMMGEGRLGYAESLADFNRAGVADAQESDEPDPFEEPDPNEL